MSKEEKDVGVLAGLRWDFAHSMRCLWKELAPLREKIFGSWSVLISVLAGIWLRVFRPVLQSIGEGITYLVWRAEVIKLTDELAAVKKELAEVNEGLLVVYHSEELTRKAKAAVKSKRGKFVGWTIVAPEGTEVIAQWKPTGEYSVVEELLS